MTAELPLANAGFSYSSDPNTGMHRTGADAQAIECGGVNTIALDPTGAIVNGSLNVTGPILSGGVAILPIGLGPLPWSGLTAPPKWVLCYGQTLVRATYPELWAFASGEIAGGNTLYTNGDGSTTFTVPDCRGRVPAGKDNMGGVAANRLTAATMTPNGNTLGATGGTQTHTLTQAQIPNYALPVTQPTFTTTGDNTTITTSITYGGGSGPINVPSAQIGGTVDAATPASVSSGGSGAAISSMQPTIITNYIIYAGA